MSVFEANYIKLHFFPPPLFIGAAGINTALWSTKSAYDYRIASSNTFFRPFCVKAEHSRYLNMRQSKICIPHCTDVFCHLYTLRIGYWCLSLFTEFINCFAVLAEIKFCTDEDNRDIRCMMGYLRKPLSLTSTESTTLVLTFSKDGGETSEKQIRKMSVWG
jgi:hypothetical protein